MYSITDTERGVIGYCDAPRYIKIKPTSGAYIQTDAEHAEGVAFRGVPYNLHNKPPMKEGLRTVIVNETDGGEVIVNEVGGLEGRTGDALCELDASLEAVKDALVELDEMIEGGN